jgi:hypothetical protein
MGNDYGLVLKVYHRSRPPSHVYTNLNNLASVLVVEHAFVTMMTAETP